MEQTNKPHPIRIPHAYQPMGDALYAESGRLLASATCRVCGANAVAECHAEKPQGFDFGAELSRVMSVWEQSR